MEQIDEKDLQAFAELQRRMIETSEKQKFAQQQDILANQALQKAALTATELERLPDSTPLYEAAGKAFFLAPRLQLLADLEEQATASSSEIKQLKDTQESLKKSIIGVETEITELLQSSQALAQAFAAGQ